MAHMLTNDWITLHIDLPEENYRLSRFDWTGKIVKLSYQGKDLTGQELPDSQVFGQGYGLYNEFGIDQPIGFDEIAEGEWFHKIGVGLLQKQGKIYDFKKGYKIQPARFEVYPETNRIKLVCLSDSYNGYAYNLTKVVSLKTDGHVITYELTNTGQKVIQTNEYVHNFLAFDEEAIGEGYSLRLPFSNRPDSFMETVNPEQLVDIGDREINFKGIPREPFFFSNLSGGETVKAAWTLKNERQKISLSETGSFNTEAINLWGWGHVISPELFFQINAAPGESIIWSRSYTVNG